MFWQSCVPVIPGTEIKDAAKELRASVTLERYRISDNYLFLPGRMFSWRFLPLREVRGVIPGVTKDSEDSVLVSYSVEKPFLRVIYNGGVEPLQFEHARNAETASGLLKRYCRSGSGQGAQHL